MKRAAIALALIVGSGLSSEGPSGQAPRPADLVADVRASIARDDFAGGEALVARYRAARGDTPELMAAVSWLGRGALAAGRLDAASQYARDAQDLAVAALQTRSLDADPFLQTALGAAIEVQAIVRARRGARSEAVYFLERELERYRDSPIHTRIQKNINQLSLVGQPAPPLEVAEVLGRPVPALAELKGRVVLLFFWAHWCPDCKAQAPVLATLLARHRAEGLAIVAPTQRYGYTVRRAEPAQPDEELRHIVEVRDAHYSFLKDDPIPVSAAVHNRYGVSTTPTLALVDRQGVVRLYRPGNLTEAELEREIVPLLGAPAPR